MALTIRRVVGLGRFELPTSRLSGVRSNQLSYRPIVPGQLNGSGRWSRCSLKTKQKRTSLGSSPIDLSVPFRPGRQHASVPSSGGTEDSFKGGDPATGSPTATLLRLHPNHRPYHGQLPPLRVGAPTSGTTGFRDVTGGVYKARERIHPGVLIRDY